MHHAYGQLHHVLEALADASQLDGHDPGLVTGIIPGALIQTVTAIAASENDPDASRGESSDEGGSQDVSEHKQRI